MRVLVADKFDAAGVEQLAEVAEVDYQPELSGDSLLAAIAEVDVLVVRSTKVPAEIIDAAPRLGLIVRAGAGVNTIDVARAAQRGVFVANCPGKNAAAVAELALGLMLSLDRQIPDAVAELRAGRWDKKRFGAGGGLKGQRLGIAGLGAIGLELLQRARGFDMEIVAWSRSLTPAKAEALGVSYAADLVSLASLVDILSVHLPATTQTRGAVNAEVLAALHDGAMFINTARADVVDNDALLAEARSGRIRVGTDVFADEPAAGQGEFGDPLGAQSSVYGTHHIGASTAQAQAAIAAEAVRIVRAYAELGEVPNCVNLAAQTQARFQLVVRHLDRVGVLAHVLAALRGGEINVQEMENRIFAGGGAAIARLQLDAEPGAGILEEIRGDAAVLQVDLMAI